MHRRTLLDRLAAYLARHPEESATVDRFMEFVGDHPDCFERACAPGHVTGSAWVLDSRGERALLTHHRKLDIWVQLGGHSDGDADTLAVALREAGEESGLDVRAIEPHIFDLDVHRIPARRGEPEHDHYDVRFLLQAVDDRFTVTDESHDLRWASRSEIPALTQEDSVLRMVRKWALRVAP
jgi:8-oxo-dGTP pyrophosphatase MutT (NUDIX family)